MNQITDALSKIDLNSLITIFDIQVALAVIVISFLFKGVLSRFIIKIVYFTILGIIVFGYKTEIRSSKMYIPLRRMILCIGLYVALRIIPSSAQIRYYENEVFKIIVILFIAKGITSIMHKDSKIFKKILNMSESDNVNDFFCRIFRGLTWIVALFIIMTELGFDLSGLATGLGIVS